MLSLTSEAWIPVRSLDGSRRWIPPTRLSDPTILAFDADRPDFNSALAQFAIGLLQTTTPVDGDAAWRELFRSPPDEATLATWFEPVKDAFVLGGDGPRFMQDFSLTPDAGAVTPVSGLFIESPGENALRNNSDHFIKRDRVDAICPACAATALFTLQTNAPSGGAGHRTGLRGGGPLTTLIQSNPPASLWHDLWLNVMSRPAHLARGGDPDKTAPHFRFPWLADIGAIQTGSETAPVQTHPDHVFWAMPRRIRLDMDNPARGTCDICGREAHRLVKQYVTKNYGLNYKGAWNHPLSPYYESKTGWLPLHPQPGGIGYRHWLAWVLGVQGGNAQRPARTVSHALNHRPRQIGTGLRLWAFGYDMDNMKARCWYESRLPLYELTACDPEAFRTLAAAVSEWLEAAHLAASYVRSAVKDAWFSADARGDFSVVDASFWSRTESGFYAQLHQAIQALRTDPLTEINALATRQQWHATLMTTAMALFDHDFVGAGQIERGKPRRVAEAHRRLVSSLYGPKMRKALRLPERDKSGAKDQNDAVTTN